MRYFRVFVFGRSLSARARSRRRTFLGASRTEEAGGAGASTQRESSGAALVGEGASGRSSPALACATIVARLPAMPMRAVGESPRRSACAGRTRPREPASVDMARARAGARERGVRSCTRTLAVGRRRGAAATDAGREARARKSRPPSRFSRCAFRSEKHFVRDSVGPSFVTREIASTANVRVPTCSPTLRKTPTRHLRGASSDYAPIQEKYKISKVCSEARAKANIETLVILEPSDG